MVTDTQIKKILNLSASIDHNGTIWGHDTEIYSSFADYVKDVRKILGKRVTEKICPKCDNNGLFYSSNSCPSCGRKRTRAKGVKE